MNLSDLRGKKLSFCTFKKVVGHFWGLREGDWGAYLEGVKRETQYLFMAVSRICRSWGWKSLKEKGGWDEIEVII